MNERLGMMADICPACEGKPAYPNNPCQVCGTSYVAPPEPSFDEVVAAVRAKCPEARHLRIWNPHPPQSLILPDDMDVHSSFIGRGDTEESAWRDAYARLEAVEGEAKPRHNQDIGVIGLPVATPTAPPEVVEVPMVSLLPDTKKKCLAFMHGCGCECPGDGNVCSIPGCDFNTQSAIPELAVTKEDEAKAMKLFDGRPTSLIPTREGLDTFALKLTAENFCRERQLAAEIAAHAQTKAALDRVTATGEALIADLERQATQLKPEEKSGRRGYL